MRQLFVLKKRPMRPETAFETDYLDVSPSQVGDAPLCKVCGGPTGPLRWLPPYRVEIEVWGGAFGDMAFGPSIDLLVSQRFVELWQESGLVGLKGFDEVEVVKVLRHSKLHGELPKYFRVDVANSRSAIDQAESGFVTGEGTICRECRLNGIIKGLRRVVLEPSPVPSEDLFIARGLPGVILASQRFHGFCDCHAIMNAILIPASDFEIDW